MTPERISESVKQEWIETILRAIEEALPFAQRVDDRRLRLPAFDEDYVVEVTAYTTGEIRERGRDGPDG